jgi:hypothetical protein
MWSFDQAKIALTLVQEWPYKNEVIDKCNKKIKKISTLRVLYFKPTPTNLTPKRLIFVIQIQKEFLNSKFQIV